MAQKLKIERTVNIKNSRASYDYAFLERFTAGIALRGTEIKSIRMSNAQLQDGFCNFKDDELYLVNAYIGIYDKGTHYNHNPRSERKLLLTKRELKKLSKGVETAGNTIVPVRLFINDRGLAKIEIALARGKKSFDKREDIKARDVQREMDRMG